LDAHESSKSNNKFLVKETEPVTIEQMEIILIKQALKRNKGSKTATAIE